MFEFRWKTSGEQADEVVLRLESGLGWFGRKRLIWRDRVVFERGWLEGIYLRLPAGYCGQCGELLVGSGQPGCSKCGAMSGAAGTRHPSAYTLRALPNPGTTTWRPALICNGKELPELSGNDVPRVAVPPKVFSIVFGVTYLLIFMSLTTLPAIAKVLGAFHLKDKAYQASTDILPWVTPSVITAACMLGLLNMRRWALVGFGVLIVLEAGARQAGMLPISLTALGIQAILWILGAFYWHKME
ncbi:MAG: hypothetical protein JXO22_05025 [Phycisphaerae bacterium]|nr:hypothetical protein [Phycisphaerae bacterium]